MSTSIVPVVLAAGKGTRMNSEIPKVLHEVFGEPMIDHVLRSLGRTFDPVPRVVLGAGRETVRKSIKDEFLEVVQENQLGTGHAVLSVLEDRNLDSEKDLLITCGDIPGIAPETFADFADDYSNSAADLMLLTTEVDDPEGYGRVKLGENNQSVVEVVEEADASQVEKSIKRINTGVLCGKVEVFETLLPQLDQDNEQGELYLTDVVELLNNENRPVDFHSIEDTWQVTGINTRRQLVDFEGEGYRRKADTLLDHGVTVHDPSSIKISPWVDVGNDVEIEGDVSIIGRSSLGDGVSIKGNTRIVNSALGPGTTVSSSTIKSSRLGQDVDVGPYAHIRPDCSIGDDVRLGNFIELKKTSVGDHSSVSHLSYVGDAEIGRNVNIGAGTITCNYDGKKKYKTVIEDDVFVGSNVEIVAPVTISKNATIGAGSTITDDVPAGNLGIGRERQKNIEDWS